MAGAAKAATHAVEHHVRHALGLKERAQRVRVGLVPHVRRHRRVQDDDLQLARRSVSHFLAAVARAGEAAKECKTFGETGADNAPKGKQE
jgi:hypothetical protein